MYQREGEGWAPLHRRLFTSRLWLDASATTKVVLVWVLGNIRHSDSSTTPAGSVDCKLSDIAASCGTSVNTTRAALSALEAADFVTCERSRYGVRVTVMAWRTWLVRENAKQEPLFATSNPAANESSKVSPDVQPLHRRYATVAPRSLQEEQEVSLASQESRSAQHGQKLTGYRETIEAFHSRYTQAYAAKPTWRAAEGAQLKKLLADHGHAEVQRRINALFDAPPRWLSPPFTFMTLVKHFDSLVVPTVAHQTGRRGGMTPEEILAHASRGGR